MGNCLPTQHFESVEKQCGLGLVAGFIQVPLACLVAMILVRKPQFWKSLRTVYYLPNVISTVALAMVWVAIYNVEGRSTRFCIPYLELKN